MGLASRRVAGPLGLLALGSLRPELVISAPGRDHAHSVDLAKWADLVVHRGCVVAALVVGYGLGYRRGVHDTINGSTPKPDHRADGD